MRANTEEEYTPTTRSVRLVYMSATGCGRIEDQRNAAFDRWLAKHDAQILNEAADLAEDWGDDHESGGYARSAYTVAARIRDHADSVSSAVAGETK